MTTPLPIRAVTDGKKRDEEGAWRAGTEVTREAELVDRWAEILAGLPTVEPDRFDDLAHRAMALAAELNPAHSDLAERVFDRLDEIWDERHGVNR